MKLKIMNFNTMHCENYKTKQIDYKSIINLIKELDIDIIGLNEIYDKWFDKNISVNQAKYIANALHYYCYFAPSTRLHFIKYGNAIISKHPINEATITKIPYPIKKTGNRYYERRSILKVNINGLNILLTHLGLNEDEQINGINTINKLIDNKNCILMGDFNINSNNKILTSLNDNMFNIDNLLKNETRTFPSDNPKIKYDYIFVSNDIYVNKAYILNKVISDHRPIIAEIEIKEKH